MTQYKDNHKTNQEFLSNEQNKVLALIQEKKEGSNKWKGTRKYAW